jgi:putative transposase
VLPIAPSTYHAAQGRPRSARARRDEELKAEITRVRQTNFKAAGR